MVRRWLLLALLLTAAPVIAEDHYLAAAAAGAQDGTSCANARLYTWFNSAANWGAGAGKITAGDTVHLCGTITVAANTTALTFQGNGTAGNPITLVFEAGAVLESPRWPSSVGGTSSGAIAIGTNRSYIVIDGGTNGVIRNTANGSGLTYQLASTGISGFNCDDCEIHNLTISNIYVNSAGDGTLGDNSVARAIDVNGSNWYIHGNVMDDCGWCLMISYGSGDTNYRLNGNQFTGFGHGIALATNAAYACTSPCATIDANRFTETTAWDAAGCPFHQDGLHFFGTSGSSMDGVYVSNNLFDGDWGTCPTGAIFVEGGTDSARMQTSAWWNNVVLVNADIVNTNGWFSINAGASGTQRVYHNTLIGENATDNSRGFTLSGLSGLSFVGNVVSNIGSPVNIGTSTLTALDYNVYGPSCQNLGNCFVYNGSFTGSFAAWKTATSGDAHSIQTNSPLLNATGVPQANSPVIAAGQNNSASATGALATLARDTTLGGARTSKPRPATEPWDVGAFQWLGAPETVQKPE